MDKHTVCTHCKKQVAIEKAVLDSIEAELRDKYAAMIKGKKEAIIDYLKMLMETETDVNKIKESLSRAIEGLLNVQKDVVGTDILNCWEFKKCGREPGGVKVAELGECPAATEQKTTGINRGKSGGRACWVIAGTFCGGRVQGTFAQKLASCFSCEFYKKVMEEEGKHYKSSREILDKLHPSDYSV